MTEKFYTFIKKYGNYIYHKGYDSTGKRFIEKVKYQPSFFVKTNEKTDWKSIHDVPMKKLDFDSIKDAEAFFRKYDDVTGFEVHGNKNYAIQFVHDVYKTDVIYNSDFVKIGFVDIETNSETIKGFPDVNKADHEVVAITVVTKNSIFCLTRKEFDPNLCTDDITGGLPIEHYQFSDECEFLSKFIDYLRREDFDILSGWHSNGFDFPFLYNRIRVLLGQEATNLLSVLDTVFYKSYEKEGQIINECVIYGTQLLDYLDVFKKYGYAFPKFENYKLDTVAEYILGENKLDYSEYGNLRNFYKMNHQKYIEYNIRDALIVKKMDDKLGFFNTVLATAYTAKTNFEETLGVIELWDSIIYGYLLSKNICVPKSKFQQSNGIKGAYVKEVVPGLYDWVLSIDAGSLYPNTIYQFNISPDTIANKQLSCSPDSLLTGHVPDEFDSEKYCLAASGQLFKTGKLGFIPILIKNFLDERSRTKPLFLKYTQEYNDCPEHNESLRKELEQKIVFYEGKQLATKILLNALYGALAAGEFRFFDPRLAESVTLTGQLFIKTTEKIVNNYLQKKIFKDEKDRVIIVDTDSNYIELNDLFKLIGAEEKPERDKVKILDKFYNDKLHPLLNSELEKLGKRLGCRSNNILFKREGIASRTLVTAKKRYCQRILNSEGVDYPEPKIKIMGFQAIRSDTPVYIKDLMKKTLKLILTETELSIQNLIKEKHTEYLQLPYQSIAKPVGVSDMVKYKHQTNIYDKGTSWHIKGSLIFNNLLQEKELTDKYELIESKDKVKVVNLITPNPISQEVIAFKDELPEEFNLIKYIDYDSMWNITYLKPITDILNICGWSPIKKSSMFSFLDKL